MTPFSRALTAVSLCCLIPTTIWSADSQVSYAVTYSGGTLPDVKGGEDLKLYLDATRIRLRHKSHDVVVIPARAISEVSYGEEVHRRIGTAAGLAIVSLGIGALVAFSKSKKHYIGITWADSDNKGGIVLQADKNEYRGLLTALEGVSGKRVIDTDSPKQAVQHTASVNTATELSTPRKLLRSSRGRLASLRLCPNLAPPRELPSRRLCRKRLHPSRKVQSFVSFRLRLTRRFRLTENTGRVLQLLT
jgi:hypothetical protein